jgi:hypothetical protein
MRRAIQKAGAIVTVIAFAFSASALADPLAPGKPAGVRAAQMGDREWLVFGGLGVLAAAVLIATNGAGEHAANPTQVISVTVPTST